MIRARPPQLGLPDPAEEGMALALVRHGQTDDNAPPLRFQGRTDTPLNEVGRSQVRILAGASPPGAGWRRIVSSDLSRAVESAAILAEELDPPVERDRRLSESDRGRWEGRLVEEVAREEPGPYGTWREAPAAFRFPGGESVIEHRDRALEALDDLLRGALPALVICHGGTMRCMLDPSLERFHDFVVPNAGVFVLDARGLPVPPPE